MNFKKPELLAPAGDRKSLLTAINSGANAIYFGIDRLNMRAKANNFKLDELKEIVDLCKDKNIDTHLTLNTIIYENEISELDLIVKSAKEAGITLIICWDFAVIQACKKYDMPFCISTQASISNSQSAKFYKDLGAKRIVLARECTLEQIIEIRANVDIEIETFIHGAMCVAISGRCFMSHYAFNKSANRGECLQPCRREYKIYDTDGEQSVEIGNDYVLSPKDLCAIEFVDELIEAGIDSFKIEGRKRSPEYISNVVGTYRKAIDLYFENKLTAELKKEMYDGLKRVYNRGFSAGFYYGTPGATEYADIYGSKATTRKMYIGKVKNYFKKTNIVHVLVQSNEIEIGDKIYISGNNTGLIELTVGQMVKEEIEVSKGIKGDDVTFKCEEVVRVNDEVYKIITEEEFKKMKKKNESENE